MLNSSHINFPNRNNSHVCTAYPDAPSPREHGPLLATISTRNKKSNNPGAKPLKRQWAGHYRIRSGDWRVIFRQVAPEVLVVRIKHRSEAHDE